MSYRKNNELKKNSTSEILFSEQEIEYKVRPLYKQLLNEAKAYLEQ